MPIRGLTDQVESRFPRLGKLRKGILVDTGKRTRDGKPIMRPKDLDHFRFTSDQPEIEEKFRESFGDKPRSLRVYLPHPTAEQNFQTWQEEWSAGGLVHKCDGQEMIRYRNENGLLVTERKPCPYWTGEKQRTASNPGCLPVGRLSVILLELVEAGYVGYVTLETRSKNDIVNIMASLREAEAHCMAAGNAMGLRGIEFRLWRQQEMISTPTPDGKRARRASWLVLLAPSVNWARRQYQIAQQAAMGLLEAGPDKSLDIEASEDIDGVSADFDEGEFYEEPLSSAEDVVVMVDEGTQANGNGNGNGHMMPERPFSPEALRGIMLQVRDRRYRNLRGVKPQGDDKKKLGLMAGKMAEALGGGEAGTQGRHVALEFLFGKASSNDLDLAEINAVLDWLVAERDPETGRYGLKDYAADELKLVVRQALREAGQQEFEFDDGTEPPLHVEQEALL